MALKPAKTPNIPGTNQNGSSSMGGLKVLYDSQPMKTSALLAMVKLWTCINNLIYDITVVW